MTFLKIFALFLALMGIANEALSAPVISVWPKGAAPVTGPQQGIYNVIGNVSGATLLEQQIGSSGWHTLSRGADGKRLARAGDFNLELQYSELSSGVNTVTIRATAADSSQATQVVSVDHNPAASWALPAAVDLSVSPWGKVAVIDGLWTAAPDGLRISETGYDRLLAVGDRAWPSGLDVTVELTPHQVLGTWAGLGIATGWQGHEGTSRPRLDWPLEVLGWVRTEGGATSTLRLSTFGGSDVVGPAQALVPGQRTSVRLYSEPQSGGQSSVKLRWWPTASTEPVTWAVESVVPSRPGSVLLVAHKVDVTFHSVDASAVAGPPPPPPPPPAAPFVSDDFDPETTLQAQWSIEDPLGDSTVHLTGERAEISVPAGVVHDLWGTNAHAPRILQAVPDENVTVLAKFSSAPTSRYQMQGLVFQEDATHLMRFGIFYDGTSLRSFVGWVAPTSVSLSNLVIPGAAPRYLRVVRTGTSWSYSHSVDGLTWTSAANVTRAVSVSDIGVYAGNAGTTAPAFTAIVERVENLTTGNLCP